MNIIEAHTEFPFGFPKASSVYKRLEIAGRTCYQSDAVNYEIRPSTEEKVDDISGNVYMAEVYDLYANDTKIGSFNELDSAAEAKMKAEFKSAEDFVRKLIDRKHEAMLEHVSLTIRFIVDRGVSHELVRHRLASFAQESTRYCNYSKGKFGNEITVIKPVFFKDLSEEDIYDIYRGAYVPKKTDTEEIKNRGIQAAQWYESCKTAEIKYLMMLSDGATPQEARSVLPNSLKTSVVMTANLREWRHFFKLRAAGITGKPHPQMLEVTVPLLIKLRELLPAVFDDITPMEV